MKFRALVWMLILALTAAPAFGSEILKAGAPAEVKPAGTPARKLQRGFLNIAFAPVEISNELDKVKKRDDALPSWAEGLGRGIWFASGRALVGAYEMLTFAIPAPAGYAPVISPEFAWEHLPPAAEVPKK